MPDRLYNLGINRVAFVPAGDNPHADIVLWKSHRPDNDQTKEADRVTEMTKEPRLTASRRNRLRAAWESIGAVIEEAGGKEGIVPEPTDKQYELPDDAPEDLRKYVEELKATADEAQAKLDKATAEDEADVDPVAKALADVPEVVRDALAKAQADAETAKADAKAAAEQVEKMQTEQETEAEIAKARELKYLRIDADKVGKSMQALRKADPDLAEQVEQALASANGTSSEAFREIGKGGRTSIDTSDAESEFERMVDEVVKTDSSITREQAFAKVAATPAGREAYSRIEEEREEG